MELSQALTRLGAGPDDGSLALLFERTAPAIRRLATRLSGDSQLGEECVAETVLSAARAAAGWRPRSADPEQDARRWVLGIAATTALSMSRARRRARARDARAVAEAPVCDHATPEAALIDGERAELLRSALDRLPKAYGEAIAARYVEGLDVEAAAARLGIPAATVKTRAFRGLALLRERLGALRGALSLAFLPSFVHRPAMLGGSLLRMGGVLAASTATLVVATVPADAGARHAVSSRRHTSVSVHCSMSILSSDGGVTHARVSASVPLSPPN